MNLPDHLLPWLASLCLLLGAVLSLLGALGVWRLPDAYSRLHAASKAVLIVTMFIGRVGAFTLLSLWVSRPEPSAKYTEEAITIG